MRWLLLDEVTEIRKGRCARAVSRIPECEFSIEVLFLEMIAQTGGVLLGLESDYQEDVVFAKVESAEFRKTGSPGDPVEIEVICEEIRPEGAWMRGMVSGAGKVLACARILLAVSKPLVPEHQGSVTFHSDFMEYFKVRERIR